MKTKVDKKIAGRDLVQDDLNPLGSVDLEIYKLLVENIEDYAIFMMDQKGIIKTWSKGAQKNKGYAANEIIGKHFSTFYLEQDKKAKKPERELELAIKHGRVEDEDWRLRKDGTTFWANVVITAIYDNKGKHLGFAKVTRDLTERKNYEDSLREANDLLRHQQKELENLNVSKDEFVSLASHQLRTPATGIKQLLGMLLEGYFGKLEPSTEDIVRKAYENNERQLQIVNSLLKVAQVDAGKVVLKRSVTNINDLLRHINDQFKDTFKNRGQSVTLDTSKTNGVSADIDANYVSMAIENILDNASKYTPEKGKINISTKKNKKDLVVRIQDSGVGIASADINKLFARFSRISNISTGSISGSGLGLYWAQKIIELHGGKIQVTSVENAGTTFKVYIPIGDHSA